MQLIHAVNVCERKRTPLADKKTSWHIYTKSRKAGRIMAEILKLKANPGSKLYNLAFVSTTITNKELRYGCAKESCAVRF